MPAATAEYDLIIAGGGLVGASLALALAPGERRIAVVEATANRDDNPDRTVALTDSSRRILHSLGVWSAIAPQATAIRTIHISDRGRFGMAHLSHRDAGVEALGYVVRTTVLHNALLTRLEQYPNLHWIRPAQALRYHCSGRRAILDLDAGGERQTLAAQLLAITDGGRSNLLRGPKPAAQRYDQTAVVCLVNSDQPNRGRAYERFTDEGPLALLPHTERAYALVWSTANANAQARCALSDSQFTAHLQSRFGDRAGLFSQPGKRAAYPLQRFRRHTPVLERGVLLGNAAHTVHPVAGQGFNLGIRAVAELAELLLEQPDRDYGSRSLLQRFARQRRRDTFMVSQFTHSLIRLFANDRPVLGLLRSGGLTLLEKLPPLKRRLLLRTMGLHGRQSRLARGLPLSAGGRHDSEYGNE